MEFDVGKLLDYGLTAVVIVLVVGPMIKFLMSQIETSRDSFLDALNRANDDHKKEIESLSQDFRNSVEKVTDSVKELGNEVKLLAEKIHGSDR